MLTENDFIKLGIEPWYGQNGQKRYYVKRLWELAGLDKVDGVFTLNGEPISSDEGQKLFKALSNSHLYFDPRTESFHYVLNSTDRFSSGDLFELIIGNLERAVAEMPRFEFEA
jgi:hypothetical protein